MEDLKIEDHPEHWKSTLLGIDFWKDAEIQNQPIHDDIEAGKSEPLSPSSFVFEVRTESFQNRTSSSAPNSRSTLAQKRVRVPTSQSQARDTSKRNRASQSPVVDGLA